MYGLPRTPFKEDRRAIRQELVIFLLDRGEREEAVTQLGVLGRELPDELEPELAAASLAVRAGDARQAFEYYSRAGLRAPASLEAAVGAGQAAFALEDFGAAVRELERAAGLGSSDPAVTGHLATHNRASSIADAHLEGRETR